MKNGIMFSFSSRIGEIMSRQISSNVMSGMTSCRIKWNDGEESFLDLCSRYDDGDKVAVVTYDKKKIATDVNLTTSQYNVRPIQPTMPIWCMILLLISIIIGFPLMFILLLTSWSIEGTFIILFIISLVVFTIVREKIYKEQVKKYVDSL